jgi:hypothetical protein
MRIKTTLPFTIAALILLLAGLAAPTAHAVPLDEAAIFIEINDTDGDAGIQLFLDGEGWEKMQIVSPDGNVLVDIEAGDSAQIQGLTEAFFESAEPSFDEQPLSEFLALWPEGRYLIRGRTNDGIPLRARVTLTHDLPAAPLLVLPIEDDEEVDPEETVIEWVTVPDPPGSEIVSYEVIVETDDDDAPFREFRVILDADATSVEVPAAFMKPGTDYKYEVIAKEASGNQTISEREFATEGGEDDDDDDEP